MTDSKGTSNPIQKVTDSQCTSNPIQKVTDSQCTSSPIQKITEGKNSWPELVGVNGDTAVATIKKENPLLDVIVVLEGSPMTLDYRPYRVRVVVDSNGVVIQTPTTG